MPRKILITGFTPFPGAPENPTAELIAAVEKGEFRAPKNVDLAAKLLPTEYKRSVDELNEVLAIQKPDALIEFGLSAKASGFTLERIARNEMIAHQADNSGKRGDDGPIDDLGPDRLESSLPLTGIHAALSQNGLPVDWSDNAGGYVCNHLFYCTRHHLAEASPKTAGFIHVPYLVEQRDRLATEGRISEALHALSREQLFRGLSIILETVAASCDCN